MSNTELNRTAEELKQYHLMLEELKATIATLEDSIKAHMDDAGIDSLILTNVRITYRDVTSSRIDSAALKKELPDVASRYTVTTTSKRFTVK